MNKIEIKNLYKIFGNKPKQNFNKFMKSDWDKETFQSETKHILGLNDVSLDIAEGKTFVIIGLSGSGKSTLVRCINRLYEPTSGQVFVDGEDVVKYDRNKLRELRRNKITMVFQKFGLFPHKTVAENIAYGPKIKGEEYDEEELLDIINLVGLSGYEESYPVQLSGGMQQRVGIARALFTKADVILMDEAFSALDPIVRKQLQDELIDIQSETEKTIVFITHDIDEALKLGDNIAIMKEGEVVQVGTPQDILTNPADEYVTEFISSSNKMDFIRLGSLSHQNFSTVDIENTCDAVVDKLDLTSPYSVVTKYDKYYGLVKNSDIINNPGTNISDIVITKRVKATQKGKSISDILVDVFNRPYPFVIVSQRNKVVSMVNRKDIIDFVEAETKGE